MAGLFLGVFAPPVRCVAIIERAGRRGFDLPVRTRVRAAASPAQRAALKTLVFNASSAISFSTHCERARQPVRGLLVEQVADQTHPGHIADPEFDNSFVRPWLLRVRFRKMTGWPACRQTGRRKCRLNRRPKQAMPGPLSNPPETINLTPDSRAGNRAGRGARQGSVNACGGPAADPYSRCRSGQRVGPGAAIWKKSVAGCFAVAHA
jgi:hypothetical protein